MPKSAVEVLNASPDPINEAEIRSWVLTLALAVLTVVHWLAGEMEQRLRLGLAADMP